MVTEDVDTDTTGTVAALRDLLQSDGWKLYADKLEQEWGALGLGQEMARVMAKEPPGPDRAYRIAEVAERVQATYDAVHQMLAWPKNEIARLTGQEKKPATALDRLRRIAR